MNLEAFNDRYPEHFVELARIERERFPLSPIEMDALWNVAGSLVQPVVDELREIV